MIIKIINIAVYIYALLWSILFLFFILKPKLKNHKLLKWLYSKYESYRLKYHPENVKNENLKLLSEITKLNKRKNDKEWNFHGIKIYAKSHKIADLLRQEVIRFKSMYSKKQIEDVIKSISEDAEPNK